MLDTSTLSTPESHEPREPKGGGQFRPFIALSYTTESNGEHEFHFDLKNRSHRERCMSILTWAARNDVEVYIVSERIPLRSGNAGNSSKVA